MKTVQRNISLILSQGYLFFTSGEYFITPLGMSVLFLDLYIEIQILFIYLLVLT